MKPRPFSSAPLASGADSAAGAARPDVATGDIYAHLRAAGHSARVRQMLSREWPLIRAELALAITLTDAATIARRVDSLRSSAFLLDNTALADEAHSLRLAAETGSWPAAQTHLAALTARVRSLLR